MSEPPTARELAVRIGDLNSKFLGSMTAEELHDWVRGAAAIIDDDRLDSPPIPMRLVCEDCGVLHIDEGEFATKPHHTHACQNCGLVWRPAVVCTVGVQFLPGFKNPPRDKVGHVAACRSLIDPGISCSCDEEISP